jgi:hypothetical protein
MTELPPRTPPRPRTESELLERVRTSDVRAPDSLHRQIQALVAARRSSTEPHLRLRRSAARTTPAVLRSRFSPWGSVGVAAAVAVAIAAIAIALVAGLGHGGSSTLNMRQTAAPMLSAATMPAPPQSSANPAKLAAAVDGVKFPYWADRFGWRSTGMRDDRMDGRTVTTVFYSDSSGHRIGYAIVAGIPAPHVGGGVALWHGGVTYRTLSADGVAIVTWLRDGHLCMVSGRDVSRATLLKLASWSDRDATAS